MESQGEDAAEIADLGEARISHFIPSVELRGSRSQKLRKLDTLISYLNRLREALAGDLPNEVAASHSLVWPTARISWPSFGGRARLWPSSLAAGRSRTVWLMES
jgi:hypothetical protein